MAGCRAEQHASSRFEGRAEWKPRCSSPAHPQRRLQGHESSGQPRSAIIVEENLELTSPSRMRPYEPQVEANREVAEIETREEKMQAPKIDAMSVYHRRQAEEAYQRGRADAAKIMSHTAARDQQTVAAKLAADGKLPVEKALMELDRSQPATSTQKSVAASHQALVSEHVRRRLSNL